MRLTVITVVYRDPEGLRRTCESVARMGGDVEQWIIDGSESDDATAYSKSLQSNRVHVLCEPDSGIYDAMNKGLDRADGDYVLFINAGDTVHPAFNVGRFLEGETENRVLLGYCVEVYGAHQYLNPGFDREERAFRSPQHQATFYPHAYYSHHRFDTRYKTGADGHYTAQAVDDYGARFKRAFISQFSLGGASSNYSKLSSQIDRMKELGWKDRPKLAFKYALWKLVPRRYFYAILASYKYTKLRATDLASTIRKCDYTTAAERPPDTSGN